MQREVVDWAEVRRSYEAGVESVPAIRARFGLTPGAFRWRRERDGWTTRPAVARAGPLQGQKPAMWSDRLVIRLAYAVEARLRGCEARATAGEVFNEAEARALTELARAVMVMKQTIEPDRRRRAGEPGKSTAGRKAPEKRGAEADAMTQHAEWMRAELTRRLDGLLEPGRAGRVDPERDA